MNNLTHAGKFGVVVPSDRLEELEQQIRELEGEIADRDQIEVWELEGVRARLEGLGEDANPYLLEADEAASSANAPVWGIGWQQADQEVLYQNVVEVAKDLLSSSLNRDGDSVVDPDLLRILALAVNEAQKYMR
jgi:hypothetical protein